MSVHPVSPREEKKRGTGQFLKIQISQSEREDEAGRKTNKIKDRNGKKQEGFVDFNGCLT